MLSALVATLTFNDEPTQYLIGIVLRPGTSTATHGAIGRLRALFAQLRAAFPDTRLRVRLDGGFLEAEGVEYVAEMVEIPVATTPKGKGAVPEDRLSIGLFGYSGSPLAQWYLLESGVDVLPAVGKAARMTHARALEVPRLSGTLMAPPGCSSRKASASWADRAYDGSPMWPALTPRAH